MSNNLNLDQLTTSQSSKEATINNATGQLDAALTENTVVDVASGNATVTLGTLRRVLTLTVKNATVARNVTLPVSKKLFIIINDASNTHTFNLVLGSTSISVPVGSNLIAFTDGTTNGLYDIVASLGATTFAGLTDAFALTSNGGKLVRVNAGATALEPVLGIIQTINAQTASYTLVLADAYKYVRMNVGSANNLTVPPNSSVAFEIGTQISIFQKGAGKTTVVQGAGVTVNTPASTRDLRAQYSSAVITKVGTDEWDIAGDLTL